MRPRGTSALDVSRYFSRDSPEDFTPPMKRSVMILPGHTVLTRMLWRPSCRASVFMSPATPGRTEFDSSGSGIGCFTDDDWMVRIRPHLRAFIDGSTARMRRTVDISET